MAFASATRFRLPKAHPVRQVRQDTSPVHLVLLFALFAFYGPAFNFAGQLRYAEVLVLMLGLFHYDRFHTRVDKLEWRLSGLFVLTAVVQAFSNYINDASLESTIARVGTYLMLAALIPAIAVIVDRNPRKMIAVLLGYSFSYVLLYYEGAAINVNYNDIPWRLGLGGAASLALVTVLGFSPVLRKFAVLPLLLLTALHVYLESRSLAAVTVLVAAFSMAVTLWPQVYPSRFRYSSLIAVVAALGFFAAVGLQSFTWLAEAELLPESMIFKNQFQAGNKYGFIASARADTLTAIYAITKQPVLGYGSGAFDADVFAFYADLNAANYSNARTAQEVFKGIYEDEWTLGIPSHSHLFGAWADAGVFAALSWMFVLALVLKMSVRLWRWDHPYSMLFVFVVIMTIWDVIFSPGPIRMEIALRVMIIATAFRYFVDFDRARLGPPRGYVKQFDATQRRQVF
jgi:hypothetical protein